MSKKILIAMLKNNQWDCIPESYGDGYFETTKEAKIAGQKLIDDGVTTDIWIRSIFDAGHYRTICAMTK